jgi:hypothetical protein
MTQALPLLSVTEACAALLPSRTDATSRLPLVTRFAYATVALVPLVSSKAVCTTSGGAAADVVDVDVEVGVLVLPAVVVAVGVAVAVVVRVGVAVATLVFVGVPVAVGVGVGVGVLVLVDVAVGVGVRGVATRNATICMTQ